MYKVFTRNKKPFAVASETLITSEEKVASELNATSESILGSIATKPNRVKDRIFMKVHQDILQLPTSPFSLKEGNERGTHLTLNYSHNPLCRT